MKILFVCTGNTCRSPMAEALLKNMLPEMNVAWEVQSAGLSALPGGAMAENAHQSLLEKEIDFPFSSQMISQELLQWADLIVTMTRGHKQVLMQRSPEKIGYIMTLKEVANRSQKQEQIEQALDQLYLKMEEKRMEIQAKYQIETADKWSLEAKEAWMKELEPMLAEEKNLRKQLDQYNLNADVHDPFGGSLEEYRACRDEIEIEIRKWISHIQTEKGTTDQS